MDEIDELDRYRAAYTLFTNLKKAEERAEREEWIDLMIWKRNWGYWRIENQIFFRY